MRKRMRWLFWSPCTAREQLHERAAHSSDRVCEHPGIPMQTMALPTQHGAHYYSECAITSQGNARGAVERRSCADSIRKRGDFARPSRDSRDRSRCDINQADGVVQVIRLCSRERSGGALARRYHQPESLLQSVHPLSLPSVQHDIAKPTHHESDGSCGISCNSPRGEKGRTRPSSVKHGGADALLPRERCDGPRSDIEKADEVIITVCLRDKMQQGQGWGRGAGGGGGGGGRAGMEE
jgi:hypothetical protein